MSLWLIDGALLGLFMVSVGVFVSLIDVPDAPLRSHFPTPMMRRALLGAAMGLTAIALIYSPLGGRSGAHMNPAVTLAFLRLGRIRPLDAAGYIACQVVGGMAGAWAIGLVVGKRFTDPPAMYAATVPGEWGACAAFIAEFAMTFILMCALLITSNTKRLARFTGLLAGAMLFLYITIEAPVSGMSINPARTLASGVPAGTYEALWVYLTAPVLGMLAAAEAFSRWRALPNAHCCKLNHSRREPCIHCGCDGPIDFDAHRNDPPSAREDTRNAR